MKKLLTRFSIVFGAGIASLALFASTASAATIYNTGDDVRVNTSRRTVTNVVVHNQNFASINQGAFNLVNTGFNQANRNIGSTQIRTGDANVFNSFSAYANSNWTSISL